MSSIRPSVKCAMVFLPSTRTISTCSPDAGYTVSWEEAGKEVSVDLTEAGALYVKKSGCEFLIYKQNDDNLNRNQRKIEYNKTNTQK